MVKKNIKLAVGIILFTIMALSLSLVLDYQRINSEFKDDVATVNKIFLQRLASIETVLTSLAGLHHASNNLNQAELSSFSEEMLKAYPFISSIIGMEKVKYAEVEHFENEMDQQGYIGLRIKQEENVEEDALVDFHLPINFIEPMTPISAKMLGLDIRSLPGIVQVIDSTIAMGSVFSSKILVSESVKKPSFFMFKALYLGRYPPETKSERESFLDGVVALIIDIEHFMEYLDLSNYQLQGKLNNASSLSEGGLNRDVQFNASSGYLTSTEYLTIYGKRYQFVLKNKLNAGMLNKQQAVYLWIVFMLIFSLLVMFLKKRKAAEDEILYLAYFDSLTSLPNRESFKEKLKLALAETKLNNGFGVVMFLDIDEFKRINDTLGHTVGDELLKQVAKRLSLQMRKAGVGDSGNRNRKTDIVTRLGGDEFTVLLTRIKNINDVDVIAQRILEHMAQPFHLNNHDVHITLSIGIATFPQDSDDVDQLLMFADTAMYHAKTLGKNNYQYYKKKMSAKIERRLELEGKLHLALERNEFQLYYQPQVDTKTNEIIGAEALIRWHQTELGLIMPDDFISIAEETGQIIEIGDWVLNESCRQNKEWQLAGYIPIYVAVNLSSLQFSQDNLSVRVLEILKSNKLAPKFLELEITESIMMKNIGQTIATIHDFNSVGIGISIDDFGTGYSSLSYLKKFPLEALKIDKSFVMDIPQDRDDMMITSAIISMAKSLGLKVIAEGVEGQGQIDFLKEHDCDILQGYHFSKPIPAKEFEELLKKKILY